MLRVIVTFGREPYEFRRFREQGKTAVDERVKLTVSQTLFSLVVNTITAAGTALVFGFGFYLVLEGELQTGLLIVLLSYVAAVYQPLEEISSSVSLIHSELVGLRASIQLLDTEPEVAEDPRRDRPRPRAAARSRTKASSFSYHRRKATLQDVSFSAEPGQRVAIVGPTGAGKTTLVSLLVRFYDVHAGRITIDGVDIRKLKLRSLREQISVVLQEPLLFSGTILENIRYGRLDASDDDVVEAARSASAHDFIERLPAGLRDGARRARRPALRRRAPAHLRRSRLHQGRADPDPGRAHLLDRLEDRGGDPRLARAASWPGGRRS